MNTRKAKDPPSRTASRGRLRTKGILPSAPRRWPGRLVSFLLLLALALFPAAPLRCILPAQTETETLHVSAQLVLVDASVTWRKNGEPVGGLRPQDFDLLEDGEAQSIQSLSQDALPLSLVFLFDLTDTVHPVLQHLASGAAQVLRHLKPEDEVAVMSFSSHTTLEQRFTRDRMSAVEGMDAASSSYDPHEPTFVFEDLWQAAQVSATSRLKDARRVQIWVTDGSANDPQTDRSLSRSAPAGLHTEADAATALLHAGVVVSAVIERSNLRGSGHFGDVEHYAELTGGPVVYATATAAEARLAALLDTLRARYTLGYKPSAVKPAGTVCHLKVQLSPAFFAAHPGIKPGDLALRARQSYVCTP